MPANHSSRRERGAVLILSILLMTALVSFGVVYVEVASTRAAVQGTATDQLQARALAEAGVSHAYHLLAEDPTWRGPLNELLGDGGYNVTVTGVAGGVQVRSIGGTASMGSGVDAIAVATTTPQLGGSFVVGDRVTFTGNSHLEWGGRMQYVTAREVNSGSVALGLYDRVSAAEGPNILIDIASAQGRATTFLPTTSGVAALSPVDYSGLIYCDGNLEGRKLPAVSVHGLLAVAGDLHLEEVTTVKFAMADPHAVLLVNGDLTIDTVDTLILSGPIYVRGDVTISKVPQLEGFGAIVTNGNLTFDDVHGFWTLDAAVNDFPPPFVSGNPIATSYSRGALTAFVASPPNLSGNSDTRGTVTLQATEEPRSSLFDLFSRD